MDHGTYCSNRETFGISINKAVLTKVNSSTNCTLTGLSDEEIFSTTVRLFVGLAWLTVVLVGTIGNTLVLFVIGYVKSMRTIPNWLLFNLAIADSCMTLLALPILAVFQTFYYPVWKLPNWSCYMLNCFTHVGALASGASLAAISVHRFIVIRLPKRIHISTKHLIITIVLIWIIAIGGSMSSFFSAGVIGMIRPISGSLHLTRLCIQIQPNESKEDFQLAFRVIMYSIYALFLFLLYSSIGWHIHTSKTPGQGPTTSQSEARKRQAVRMLAVATVAMIVCYLPYITLVGVNLFAKAGYFSPVFAIEIFTNILTGVNHAINPFIYCAFSSQFRKGFKKFFHMIKNGKGVGASIRAAGSKKITKRQSSAKLFKRKREGTFSTDLDADQPDAEGESKSNGTSLSPPRWMNSKDCLVESSFTNSSELPSILAPSPEIKRREKEYFV
eukprot:Seg4353.6 transcript_id=Seg4353.6/GoldUCD/mRNA.D3Y31 product="RYamide receptor" protein_id=Seg4353.6/GoldUCD/D3Y31